MEHRSLFTRILEFITGNKTKLVPYNYGQKDCPVLEVGDRLFTITENDSYDLIAMSCGISDFADKSGYKTIWKVKEVTDGNAFIESKSGSKTFLRYLKWDDGNRVTCPTTLMYTEKRIRFFKIEIEKKT